MRQSVAVFSPFPAHGRGSSTGALRRSKCNKSLGLIAAIAAGFFVSPAAAQSAPKTRLVNCGEQTCLKISGQREHPATNVSINGNPVSVEGNENWHVLLTLDTVRGWSPPHARKIEVTLHDTRNRRATSVDADLPIGLLGNVTTLAALEVTVS